jgi:hypothetical protein
MTGLRKVIDPPRRALSAPPTMMPSPTSPESVHTFSDFSLDLSRGGTPCGCPQATRNQQRAAHKEGPKGCPYVSK